VLCCAVLCCAVCALVVQEADALELVTVDGMRVVVETAEAQAVFTQMRQASGTEWADATTAAGGRGSGGASSPSAAAVAAAAAAGRTVGLV
jgi:hypothetical protein